MHPFQEQQARFKVTILTWLVTNLEIEATENGLHIVGVEENAGSIWIDLSDGTTKSLAIIDCEPENPEI